MKITFILIGLVSLIGSTTAGNSCGQPAVKQRPNRKFGDGDRIVGGVEARPFSFPWIVSIQQYGSHFCGGSLIRVGDKEQTDIVVTAAHCVYDGFQGPVTINAGAHDLYRPTSNQQTVALAQAIYHPQYNPDITMNDIAILVLQQPIKFTKNVQPICLPDPGETPAPNTEATVAGWGLTEEGAQDVSRVLNQVGVPIIDGQTCGSMYSQANVQIDPTTMLCAGYSQGGKDACQGDSGGPFVINNRGTYVLEGVVSFGVGCARAGLPGVYTHVSNYIPWIQEQIQQYSRA